MSDIDKLWFEMGVRDNVSKVLERVLEQAEQLGLELNKAQLNKNLITNAENLERVYDRIGVAMERINEARSKTKDKGELSQLKDMEKNLDKMIKAFQKLENSNKMITLPGTAAFERLVQQFQLAMEQVSRYTNEIDKEAKTDERNKAAEAKRIDDLQAKYNELYRIRRQLQDAVINASPDSNTTDAVKEINRLSAIIGAVKRAQVGGGLMPKSADGANYDEYLRRIRERIQNLTSATADYNTRLRDNESIRQSLNRIKLDTESQQTVAVIRNQVAEYNALSQKLREVAALMRRVEAEEAGLSNGTITKPTYTRDRVTEELEAIQRRYNETLARGKQALMDDADAKRRNEAATRRMTEAAKEVNRVNADMVNSFNRVLDKVTHSNRMIGQLQQQFAGYVGLYGLERLLKNVIQIGGEFEIQHIALQSILGDIQQANSMFEQMKELAVVSPFNFRQLASYSKQIAAFGIPYEEMYDTTKRLADMAAGLGVDMGRLILAYGQVRSAAVLRGQELRQFTEAGIPMVQALAQEFTKLNGRAVSTAEVFELISKRAVPFEMVKKVMWDMTNEGGRFYDMQFTLSDTLAGKWSNLQDAWEIMLSEFARGESMSGKFLKGAVSGITALIESANTLMPLLAGIGMFFAGRRIKSAFDSRGLAGLDAQITKAQNLQRIELRRMYLNQEITRAQYEQRMAMNNSQARYYLLLAQEGKLKNYQIQRLIIQKQINNARLQELVKSGELTMREAAQVRLWRMKNGEISAFRMQMNGMMSGVGSFFKANAWLIGIDLAITALTTWYTRSEEAKAKNEELKDGFVNTANSLKEAYASIENETPLNTEEYKKGLDGLKEILKQYSSDYERMIREAQSHGKDSQMMFGTDPIIAEYNFLKGILKDEQKILEEAESKAESFGETTRDAFEKAKESARFVTTGRQSFWDVMFGADTDVQRGLNTSIKKLYEKILEAIPDVGKNETSNELYRKLRDSIEEQLGIGSKEKMLINIKLNELFNIDNIEDATTLVVDKFGDMLNQTEPEIANKIRYSTKGLNDAEKDKVAELIREASEETKKRYPYYADTLQKLLNDSNFIANIQLRFSGTGGAVSEYQKQVYDNFPVVTSEKQKITAVNWAKSGSSYAAANAAKKDIDDAKNELVAREREYKAGKTTAERVQKAKEEYEEKVQAALVGIGYDYEGENKKSNKVKGGSTSKKDTELERIKNQVDLYKKFYSELENYSKIYGRSGALSKLRNDGEFGAVFGWDNVSDVSNYRKTVRELTSELKNNSEARDKFLNSTKADIQAKARKEETEAIRNYVSELQRMMSVMSDNYDTYKKWVDLTGDSALAARVAGVAVNTTYSDWLKDKMTDELKKTNLALSASDVFGLSESEAKKLGEGNGLFKVWEEWQKNQQKIKKDQLNLYEDAIKNAKGYEEKIADINRQLEKEIEAIEKLEQDEARRNLLIGNARTNAEEKISEIEWEKFKKESDWGRVFGDLDNMSLTTIKNMVESMKKFQKETKLSEKETRAWQKAMKDLSDKAITIDPVNSLTEAVKKYNEALKEVKTAKDEKSNADRLVNQIQGEVATNPQAAESKQKRLEEAIKKQTDASNKLGKAEDNAAEAFNALKKSAVAIANSIKNLGSSLSSLGSSVGGDIGNILGGFGTMFSQLGNGISAIQNLDLNAKGFTGIFNKVSAVMTVVTSMIDMNKALASILPSTQSIYQKRAEEQMQINQLRAAVDAYRVAVAKARAEESGWIGDNPLKNLQDAYKIHGEIATEYYNKLYEAQEAYVESAAGIKSALIPIVAAITAIVAVAAGVFTAGTGTAAIGALGATAIGALSAGTVAISGITAAAIGASIAAGVGAAVGQAIQAGIDAISYDNGKVDARQNMKVQTRHRTFFRSEKTQNLEEWTKEELGLDLFDKSGLIDLKVAQAVLDSGATLVGETKQTLEKLMELREQYDEWEKSVKDYISSTFGGLADDMTNAIWDWLDGGKDAMDSFKDYASNTFKQIAQDAVKTFLKVSVLDKFEQQLEDLYKAYSMKDQHGNRIIDEQQLMLGVASIAGDMAVAFEQILPLAQQLGETITNAFGQQGYDVVSGSSDSSSSSSNTIRSITEGTGDLIASYINAIRADVSVNRVTLTQILSIVQTQSEMPVIARAQLQQLQEIAKNTLATANNTALISDIYKILNGNINGANKFVVK